MQLKRLGLGIRFDFLSAASEREHAQQAFEEIFSVLTLSELEGLLIYGPQARSYDPKDYKIGEKILFPMATGRRVEEQTLIYRGKEEIEANNDTIYRCLVFSFVEYKKGKEKEVITFFVSDDKNHLPIRLDMYLNFGSAKAFLKSVRGNRYPMTSVVTK